MAMNQIQFQRGLSLKQFLSRYGTEEQCFRALERARWPSGFVCPRCGHTTASQFQRGHQRLWQCSGCRTQTSLTAGTPLADTKLPLQQWWLAMYLMCQAKNGVSALELTRHLDVCYRTAWRLKHKLMVAMADRETSRQLHGLVQIDDAYLGGERPSGASHADQWENKVPFVAAVETRDGRPWYVRFDCVSSFRRDVIDQWARDALATGAKVVSDGLTAFTGVVSAGFAHEAIITGSGRKSVQRPELRWVNTILGNLKTSFSGTYHAMKFAKYGPRYMAEMQYRFNRRFRLDELVGRLGCALMSATAQPEHVLRAPAEIRR